MLKKSRFIQIFFLLFCVLGLSAVGTLSSFICTRSVSFRVCHKFTTSDTALTSEELETEAAALRCCVRKSNLSRNKKSSHFTGAAGALLNDRVPHFRLLSTSHNKQPVHNFESFPV